VYQVDPSRRISIRFFAQGFEYRFLGVIPMTRHLIGVDPGLDAAQTIFVLGTDVQGRDLWSRLMYATRISLTIGLLGVTMSLVLGVVLGGLSGFYGGIADTIIQRVIEILRSIPTIPLWMGLAAALPRAWTVLQVYFAITIIISCWAGPSWRAWCAGGSWPCARKTSSCPRGWSGAARCAPSSCTWCPRS
jgi:peptide/nickel transport system permease protein